MQFKAREIIQEATIYVKVRDRAFSSSSSKTEGRGGWWGTMMGTGKSPVRVKQEQEHEVNLAQPGRRVQGRAVVVVWCGV